MFTDKLRQILNFSFAVLQPLVAILVNLEITGPGIGTISDRYPTYVVPAGYAFSIWALIFTLTVGYGIWQMLPAQRTNPLLRRVGWLTASALLASSVWMLVFQRSWFGLSIIVMLWLLGSLIGVLAQLYPFVPHLSTGARWWGLYTFSIYLGWITVATIANVGQTMVAYGWDELGFDAETWGLIALFMAGVIVTVVIALTKGNVPYTLTVIWALAAIAVNQFTGAVPTNSNRVGIVTVALILLLGTVLWVCRRRSKENLSLHAESFNLDTKENPYAG